MKDDILSLIVSLNIQIIFGAFKINILFQKAENGS